MDRVAQRAVHSQVERAPRHRMEQVVEALHHGDARGIGCRGDPVRLQTIARERLFGQYRLTRRDGRQIPRRVPGVRQRVVHDINHGIVDDVGIRRQSPFHAMLFGERLCPQRVTRGDGDQPVPQFLRGPDDRQLGDAGRPENPDPQAHARTGGGRPA